MNEIYHIVSMKWFNRWKQYTYYEESTNGEDEPMGIQH